MIRKTIYYIDNVNTRVDWLNQKHDYAVMCVVTFFKMHFIMGTKADSFVHKY